MHYQNLIWLYFGIIIVINVIRNYHDDGSCDWPFLFFQLFGCFIDQYLKLFDEQVNPSTNTAKPVLEILKPSVELIGERRYWISGQHDIFLLNSGNSFAYKMTQEEIVNLPVEVIFVGRDNPNYIVDEKRAFEIIVQIIGKTNQLQPPGNKLSFPLGSYKFLTVVIEKNMIIYWYS